MMFSPVLTRLSPNKINENMNIINANHIQYPPSLYHTKIPIQLS